NVRTDVPTRPVRLWHCRNEFEYERKVQQMKEDAFQVVSAQAQDQFIELVQKHFIVLTRKRSQSTYFDDYEVRQDDDWRKHIRYFIHSVAFPSIDTQGLITKPPVEWVAILNELVPYVPPETINLTMSDVLTGIDYESFVAGLFEDAGWTAQLTAVTGDHGADIIVSYGGVRVAVQCKLYSSPVGNDSVQEAHAAKGFYHCQLAMVISNADYTKAARQLASSLGVVLAHHDTALHKLNDLMQRSLQGAR
ncbi:MAG: restriction endonuclease, partial [Hafnia sp.]